MAGEFGRRTLIHGVFAVGLAALAGCTVPSPEQPSPTATVPPTTGSPSGSPPMTVPPVPGGARPAVASSYGPNGTHYPPDLPWLGDAAPTEVTAECDWVDIARKVKALTPAEVAGGAVIRVKPGTLPGAGAKSSSRPALGGIGDPAWSRNVLICPRDGFGTVEIAAAGIRLDQCARLSFFGFVSAGGFALTQCADIEIGWSRFDSANITRGGSALAFYELVLGFRRNPEDTSGMRPTESYEMTGLARYGCVYGPSVKPRDSDAHCDTLQLEGTGDGPFGPFTSVDCVDYGSSNSAELLHTRLTVAEYRHCLVLAGRLPWRVYPLQSGDYEGEPNAFAGGCQDVRMYDSVVAGAIGRMGFTEVHNTRLSYAPQSSQQPSRSGEWEVDTAVAGWDRDEILAEQAVADYELPTLRALWAW